MIQPRLETRLELTVWLLFACLAAASLVFMSWPFTLGLFFGGAISCLNFFWLKRDLKSFFSKDKARGKLGVIFKFYVRLALTALALYFIIAGELADIFGLLIGLSVVILGLALGVLWEANLPAGGANLADKPERGGTETDPG